MTEPVESFDDSALRKKLGLLSEADFLRQALVNRQAQAHRFKEPLRQTGRTTNLLLKAFSDALSGNRVVVVSNKSGLVVAQGMLDQWFQTVGKVGAACRVLYRTTDKLQGLEPGVRLYVDLD